MYVRSARLDQVSLSEVVTAGMSPQLVAKVAELAPPRVSPSPRHGPGSWGSRPTACVSLGSTRTNASCSGKPSSRLLSPPHEADVPQRRSRQTGCSCRSSAGPGTYVHRSEALQAGGSYGARTRRPHHRRSRRGRRRCGLQQAFSVCDELGPDELEEAADPVSAGGAACHRPEALGGVGVAELGVAGGDEDVGVGRMPGELLP